ncbi:MAG TPA: hypothetical protein PKE00_16145, partial [Planctomycetota bacterium]|nr:hypothetical protein [Planctomycetota bacterium]
MLGFLALSSAACSSHRAAPKSPAAAAREAFFEALLARTLELDPRTKKRRTALEATRARFEDAHDDTELFRALCAFDAARGRGGLAPLPKQAEAEATPAPSELPLRFEAERSGDGRWHYFVCDLPFDAHYYLPDSRPEVGDVVVGLHGLSVDAWVTRARGLVCDSTEAATHAEVARAMSRRTPTWPTELVPDEPSLRLRRKDGREVDIPIAWTKRPVEQWLRVDDPYYDGFSRVLSGGRRNLVELRFDEPKSVTLRPSGGGGLALEVVLGAMGAVDVGFEFADTRALAGDIAHDARGELRAERLGPALVLWQRLLDEQPYDPTLVAEAEAERARLV